MVWFAYAMVWLSTALAAIAGMYFTHSAWCLWALILPACISIKKSGKDDKVDFQ